ncbi:transmembrane protein 254-like [Tubulanus polymorphus]|uniref:transmembrane protein 254-like n=1 Tax=Tubulanus polymorphus TaxID=672921 RepID=UPI003DA6A0ED
MAAPSGFDFFRRPGLLWFVLIIYGMAICTVAPFRLDLIPCEHLGPLGEFIVYLHFNHKYLLCLICIGAWIAHVCEAMYANVLCKRKNISRRCRILWIIQTFIVGFPSLRILKSYEPPPSATSTVTSSNKKQK